AKERTNRHAQVVRLLQEHGADANGANRRLDMDLLEAALRGRLQEVRQLIARGADSNARDGRGFTVLMKASGHPKTAAYLIEQGADPFALNRGKASVLHDAAGSGNLALVKQLLALGAVVDLPNHNNETPLCEATQTGKLAVVKLLLEQGADPNIRSRFGTPLMLAIERDNQAMIDLLKQWGAR
ncbi:ankyrin repeat domain-containing protein, partial [Sedimenticola sp.]